MKGLGFHMFETDANMGTVVKRWLEEEKNNFCGQGIEKTHPTA
jgi:hypothetical protein